MKIKTKNAGLLVSLVVAGMLAGSAPVYADDAGVAAPIAETAPVAAEPDPAPPSTEPTPAPEVPQTGLEALRDQILAVLIPTFVLFIGGLAVLILRKVSSKLGLDLSDKVMQQWGELARQAALRGAEYARKKLKDATDGKKVPGPEVLDVAVNWATQMAIAQGLPVLAREKLEGLIEAHLFELRREEAATPATDPYSHVTKVMV